MRTLSGRSIFAILERNLITHALENIQQRLARGSQQPTANFVTTSRAGQLIRVQMAPVLGAARDAIDRMGARYVDVFRLRFVDGYSESEIASQLDLSLATVKTRAHRARLAARTALTPAA